MRLLYEPGALAHHLHSYDWGGIVGRFEGVARGERLMVRKHAWFSPFFLERVQRALDTPNAGGRFWALLVDRIPGGSGRLRRTAERRANTWYYRRLAARYLDAWEGAT